MKTTRKPTTFAHLAAIGSLSLLTLVACGGASGLATAELTNEMDDICEQVQEDMDALDQPTDSASAAEFFGKVLEISKQGSADLGALKAADSADGEHLADMISALEESDEITLEMIDAAKDEDDAAAGAAYEKYQAALVDAADAADEVGADTCAEIGTFEETEEPATTEPAPVETVALETPAVGSVTAISLGDFINPPAGYELEEVPADGIAADLSTMPGVTGLVATVGAGTATDALGTNVVVGMQLYRELSPSEVQDFLGGVVEDASDFSELELAGVPGIAFIDSTGMVGSSAVVGRTAFVVLSPDATQLETVMTAIVAAN